MNKSDKFVLALKQNRKALVLTKFRITVMTKTVSSLSISLRLFGLTFLFTVIFFAVCRINDK